MTSETLTPRVRPRITPRALGPDESIVLRSDDDTGEDLVSAQTGPERAPLRPEMRDEDPRERAAQRAAQIMGTGVLDDEGSDDYRLDEGTVPPGWDYEWKNLTVTGMDMSSYQSQMRRTGWEAVPANRHPHMMAPGHKGAYIERKGMILMERPLEVTEAVRAADLRRARVQVRAKEEQLTAAPQGQFERRKSDGTSLAKVNRSYESIPIPKD